MGIDHSTLALAHDIAELGKNIRKRKLSNREISAHGWSGKDVSRFIAISDAKTKATYKSDIVKPRVFKGCTAYGFGVHFFEITWSPTANSEDIAIGIAAGDLRLQGDGKSFLGCNDQSAGWYPLLKVIKYNGVEIKQYPEKQYNYPNIPNKVTLVLNMDQEKGSFAFRTQDEVYGTAMCGLKNVSNELYVAGCMSTKGETMEMRYLGSSEMLDPLATLPIKAQAMYDPKKPLEFHRTCGANVSLDEKHLTASRNRPRQTYNGATVLTERPLNEGEAFNIKIEGLDDVTWTGSLLVGVTSTCPTEITYPKDSMADYMDGDTWVIRDTKIMHNGKLMQNISTDIDDLKLGDTITLQKSGSELIVTIKGQKDVVNIGADTEQLYGFVDIYGQNTAAKLTPGRTGIIRQKIQPKLSSLNEFFTTMKKKDLADILSITERLRMIHGSKLQKCRHDRQAAGDTLSTNDRPSIIKEYIDFLKDNIDTEADKGCLTCLTYLLQCLTIYTNTSLLFCKTLGRVGLLDVMMTILQDQSITKENGLTDILLTIFYNCAKASENIEQFRSLDFVEFAQKYTDIALQSIATVTLVLFTISYIYTQDEISLMELPEDIATYIIQRLHNSTQAGDKVFDGWHVREIVTAVTNLTAYSTNSLLLVQNGVIEALMRVLNLTDVYDQENALNAIWSLTNENTKLLVNHTENFTERLHLMTDSNHPTVKQAALRVLAKVKVHGQVIPGTLNPVQCKYKSLCERFKVSLNLPEAFFDPTHDICYCENCHAEREDESSYTRGDPPKKFGIPVGWCRFALKPDSRTHALNAFQKWHRAFHGTKKETVENILNVGNLAPAGSTVLGGNEIKELPGHFSDEGYKPEGFNTKRIFLSPSIRYAGIDTYATPYRFTDPLTEKSHMTRVAFLVLVDPESYEVGVETIGAEEQEIDPDFSNQEMEWIVNAMGSTILYGLLVKIDGYITCN